MKLNHGLDLAYCTNIHRGESWPETLAALQTHTLAVRQRVCPDRPYAIGLRLSQLAAVQLSEPAALTEFRHWLDRNRCYVFTINGFPFGQFHGVRVKEQVYRPDWTSEERVDYTNLLFDLLAQLVPPGGEGSVSTVPGSFKEFITDPGQEPLMRRNVWQCVEHAARLTERTGTNLHLGMEPEPLCYFETSAETIGFLSRVRDEHPKDPRFFKHLGVNYDTCHLAVEFEEPGAALTAFESNEIKISKLHLSSALKIRPTPAVRQALAAFADDTYFHQVIARTPRHPRLAFRDLGPALAEPEASADPENTEWRIHFHIPLHSPDSGWYRTTSDHVLGVLDYLKTRPTLCSHLEMETYTWEVMPPELKNRSVVDQLVSEYDWVLQQMATRGLA